MFAVRAYLSGVTIKLHGFLAVSAALAWQDACNMQHTYLSCIAVEYRVIECSRSLEIETHTSTIHSCGHRCHTARELGPSHVRNCWHTWRVAERDLKTQRETGHIAMSMPYIRKDEGST